MAFHQPTRQVQQQRIARVESEDGDSALFSPLPASGVNESQTWVLFTPGTDAGTSASYLSSLQDDQVTPGRSRISVGSLDTAARSDRNSELDNSAVPSDVLEESVAEDDGELDILDSHLPDFRTLPNQYAQQGDSHATPVLPAHDGLGSFRFDSPAITTEAQERLYAFEKFNPNRVRGPSETLERLRSQVEDEDVQELERNRRIEAWRLEQSQLLLDNIRKETRRRQSEASIHSRPALVRTTVDGPPELSVVNETPADVQLGEGDWHDHDSSETPDSSRQGMLSRIARKVIRDLMGIDDNMLAVLFGEALPEEEELSSTPKASSPAFAHKESESSHDSTWQLHMLERIARELGLLVHQMSTHPGAFSAYTRVQQTPLPYAGLPAIPEALGDMSEPTAGKLDSSTAGMPQFQPTAQSANLPGLASEPPTPSGPPPTSEMTPSNTPQTFTQQEWEQDLDIRLVFRYLRSRFTSSRPSSPPFTSGSSHLAASSSQEAAAKAARVRQHHPLVSHAHHRTRSIDRRTFKVTTPSSPVVLRHPNGSCASQSTRRSARRSSVSSRHSSRHYWDIGGSVGTGSMIASTGPMGSWGEV